MAVPMASNAESVMTLSEAWTNAARAVKFSIRQEQKSRIEYLKNTDYGKQFLMLMTEVASVVVDQETIPHSGGKGSGNTMGMLGAQQLLDVSAYQSTKMADREAASKKPSKTVEHEDPMPTTQHERKAPRKRPSAHARPRQKPNAADDEKSTAAKPQEERSATVAGGMSKSGEVKGSSGATSGPGKRRSKVKGAQKSKAAATEISEQDMEATLAAQALGGAGAFGIF